MLHNGPPSQETEALRLSGPVRAVRGLLSFWTALLLLAPVLAAAEMDIYGTAHVSADLVGNDDPNPVNESRIISLTSNKSRLGLRGIQALGGGLDMLWQFESYIDLDDGGWGAGRDSFLGLRGALGTLRMGRYVTPYRMATDPIDVFTDTRADYNAVIGAVNGVEVFNNRARNILLYMTPDDKSLQFSLAYMTNPAGTDDLPRTKNEAKQTGIGSAFTYRSGPLFLGLGYERLGALGGSGNSDARATKFGGRWNFGQGTTLGVIWENASSGVKAAGQEEARTAYYMNLAHLTGNHTFKFAYGRLGDLDTAAQSGANHFALGYSLALSGESEFYLLYTAMGNDANAAYGLQPDHDATGAVAAAVPSADPTAFSLGFVHRFATRL